MASDITAVFLTSNTVPKYWTAYHKKVLLNALGDIKLLIVSRKPMNYGNVNLLDFGKKSATNYYVQLLKAARLVSTPYIAIIEDDTLYSKDHFTCYRPPLDTFAYNIHRWSVATWGEPVYSKKDLKAGAAGIYPRFELIDALEEKLSVVPLNASPDYGFIMGEPGTGGEARLNIKIRKSKGFNSVIPIIQFNHDYFSNARNDKEMIARRHTKSFGIVRAYDIPYWGRADKLISRFR